MTRADADPTDAGPMGQADVDAVLACYRSGWWTMGPRTMALETAFAELTRAPHAVAVASGTAALHLALLAAGAGPGDEVIVSALAGVGAAGAIVACGATPVFADVGGILDHHLDPADVQRRLTPSTRAVLVTHRWGYPCDLTALRGLLHGSEVSLVQDATDAILADGVGGDGDLTCYSLSATRQLTVGQGGLVTTGDAGQAARVRSLRSHAMTSVTWDRHRGHAESYDVVDVGFNHRIDEPRAALALSRLPRLRAALESRRTAVRAYRAALADIPGVALPWTSEQIARSSHGRFGVVFAGASDRERARAALGEAGIPADWRPALSRLTAYAASAGSVPRAEDAGDRHLTLPLSSCTPPEEVAKVAKALGRAGLTGFPSPVST